MNAKTLSRFFIAIFLISSVASAQFGKNIVQYEKFHWKYIQTSHFDVYYNAGSKYLAEFAAIEAEKALIKIQNDLNYDLQKKVKIIVYDTHNEFQQNNILGQFMFEGIAGVTELFKNRVVIPFQENYSQFRHTVHHELVHAVVNNLFYGGAFQSALRSGFLGKIPIWLNEGLAEFESLGGNSVETDMFMRDAALREKLRPISKMSGYYAYRGGQALLWYVSQKYGKRKVGDLIQRLKATKDINAAFKSAFNKNVKEFSEEFNDFVKKYYWPDIAKYKFPKDYAVKVLKKKDNSSFVFNSSPAVSPDGKKLAYIAAPDGLFGIYVKDLENEKAEPKEIVESFRKQDFEDLNVLTPGLSWNPDGTKLAVSAKAGGEDAIFIVDVETGDYEKLTFGLKSITSSHWSPDGEKIAFIGSKRGKADIYCYYVKKKKLARLTDDVFSDASPVWSPDSKEIYFISDRGDYLAPKLGYKVKIWKEDFNVWDIYRYRLSDSSIKRITKTPKNWKTSLDISSDGKYLLYTSDKNGILNVYKMNLATGKVVPLTNSAAGITQIDLSKDDSKLFFAAQTNLGYDIFYARYPLEIKLDKEPPLTKYKALILKTKEIVSALKKKKEKKESYSKRDSIRYGNFFVDFSRQSLVKPNPDAEKRQKSVYDQALQEKNWDDADFVERDYKIAFTPDIISGDPGYNTFWGFQGVTSMLFSDVMGDHVIYFQANLLIDLRNSSFYAAYIYRPDIIDYSFSGYHQAGLVYYGLTSDGGDSLYRFRDFGVSVSASYPLDLFNRIEWGLNLKNVSKENVFNSSEKRVSRLLFVPEASYVHDDVLWGIFAPAKGSRYYFKFFGTPKLSESSVGFLSLLGDYRRYWQISDYTTLAVRGAFGASMGPNPQNFYLGGVQYWINSKFSSNAMPFNEPEDFAFINSSIVMPLRGFEVGKLRGNRYFLCNVEFRFPFIGWFFATPIPISQAFMGAVFADVGGAWSGNWLSFKATETDAEGNRRPRDLVSSAGVGVRTSLLGLPFKVDVAWANLIETWSKPQYIFSLGYDF